MSMTRSDLDRMSLVLYLRGFLLLALAAVAVRWPDETLVFTMSMGGAVVGLLGVFELGVATVSRASRSTKGLMSLHAALAIAFGIVTLAARFASVRTTIDLMAIWLMVHAVAIVAIVGGLPMIRRARAMLLAWSAVNLLCAFVVVAYPGMTFARLAYLGAAYAAAYGVVQIGAGRSLHRQVTAASKELGPPLAAR